MSAEIAYLSNRAYAFQPYLWDIQTRESAVIDVIDGVTLRSAIIPLNAFISGPAAGGSMPAPTDPNDGRRPRSVSWKWYDQVPLLLLFFSPCIGCADRTRGAHLQVCPQERRTYVDAKVVRRLRDIPEERRPSGKEILEAWAAELGNMTESCVVVTGDHVWTFE